MFYCRICGLDVASQLALPGVVEVHAPHDEPDVVVRYGDIPSSLDRPSYVGPTWQVSGQRFLFEVPGVARFLVNDGRAITIELNEASTKEDAAPFLLGTGIGAILHQRGELLLHGSAVALNNRAVILSGPTGAGKSTVAAALCKAGFQFLSDDVSVIRFDSDDHPVVTSDGRQHKLWSDSIQHLSLADRQRNVVREKIHKFYVDPPRSNAAALLPVVAVFLLDKVTPPDPPSIIQLSPVNAAPLLRENVFKSSLAQHMGRNGALFGQIASLLRHSAVFRLERARGFDRINETLETIKAAVEELS
ncbi:MAG: hypothetical protein V4568_13245 [Pseudomonadota bacterium]